MPAQLSLADALLLLPLELLASEVSHDDVDAMHWLTSRLVHGELRGDVLGEAAAAPAGRVRGDCRGDCRGDWRQSTDVTVALGGAEDCTNTPLRATSSRHSDGPDLYE